MEQLRLTVCAPDPITLAGVQSCFRSQPAVVLVQDPRRDQVDVVVAVFDRLSTNAIAVLQTLAAQIGRPIVLIVDEIKEAELLETVECQVVAILPRVAATDGRLADTVRDVATGPVLSPTNSLERLLDQAERLHRETLAPSGLTTARLSEREIELLRLMANGLATNEIARVLAYSEQTIKTIVHKLTKRLGLRNRTQAVAYAMRAGVI
jgi:DNA-binding NarL/FixJ family response regulator